MGQPLPTAELHVHIEGTLEPEMVFALARRNQVRLPFAGVEDLRGRYAFRDLQSFLDLYYACSAVLQQPEDFADLAVAYLERASHQGVRHAEIFFDPQAHTERGVPLPSVIEGLRDGLERGGELYGVSAALIACFLRDRGPVAAMATLRQLLPYRDALIGVGLDSAEVGHPPRLFAEVFSAARSEGLHLVAHAGEEGPPGYVVEALELLGVERIDHGVRCMEDGELVKRLAGAQVPFTVCPLSNLRLGVVKRLADHPLPAMLASGLLVTVNSDDPAYFGGYVGDNYAVVAETFRLPPATLRQLARNSFRAAFISEEERAGYLAELEDDA